MTEKKTRAKKARLKGVPTENDNEFKIVEDSDTEWELANVSIEPVETTPAKGPDYHITDTGEILLDSGGPIPEDHPVHPVHRALAAARKASQ